MTAIRQLIGGVIFLVSAFAVCRDMDLLLVQGRGEETILGAMLKLSIVIGYNLPMGVLVVYLFPVVLGIVLFMPSLWANPPKLASPPKL